MRVEILFGGAEDAESDVNLRSFHFESLGLVIGLKIIPTPEMHPTLHLHQR
jgi:hypothetical protein